MPALATTWLRWPFGERERAVVKAAEMESQLETSQETKWWLFEMSELKESSRK